MIVPRKSKRWLSRLSDMTVQAGRGIMLRFFSSSLFFFFFVQVLQVYTRATGGFGLGHDAGKSYSCQGCWVLVFTLLGFRLLCSSGLLRCCLLLACSWFA